jgi:hypothetical protein
MLPVPDGRFVARAFAIHKLAAGPKSNLACCSSRPVCFGRRAAAFQRSVAGVTSSLAVAYHRRGFLRAPPNPSIERTSKGWPRYARSSLFASRGQPSAASHVKR